MKTYSVAMSLGATMYVKVKANSEEEAKDKAWEEAQPPSLCWQCADGVDLGEIDKIIEVVEEE